MKKSIVCINLKERKAVDLTSNNSLKEPHHVRNRVLTNRSTTTLSSFNPSRSYLTGLKLVYQGPWRLKSFRQKGVSTPTLLCKELCHVQALEYICSFLDYLNTNCPLGDIIPLQIYYVRTAKEGSWVFLFASFFGCCFCCLVGLVCVGW